MKRIILFSINYIFLTLLFAFANNKVRWSIHNYRIKHNSLIYEHIDLITDISGGLVFSLIAYLLYLGWVKIVKRKNVLKTSLIFAMLNFIILSFLIAILSGWIALPIFILSVAPIFVVGLVLPFSEWLFAKMIKYKFKGM